VDFMRLPYARNLVQGLAANSQLQRNASPGALRTQAGLFLPKSNGLSATLISPVSDEQQQPNYGHDANAKHTQASA
jgi:hypothetical protein